MSISQKILFYIPTVPLGIIMTLIAVGLAVFGFVIAWRFAPRELLKSHNELASALFGAIATAYMVLLAFVVVVSWQNFDRTYSYVETEANRLVDLYRCSAAFPQSFKEEAETLLKEYEDRVLNDEWDRLAKGEESPKAGAALRKIWALFEKYEPVTEREKAFFAESIDKLSDLREARRLRILESRTGISSVLWFILIVGGVTTVSFTFFFGSDSFKVHVTMAAMLAALIGLILLVILLFEFPFTGGVRIAPETFRQLVNF